MAFLIDRAYELWEWLLELPADFAFLLSLPFAVALAGLLSELGRGRRGSKR